METKQRESITQLIESMNSINYFKVLKPNNNNSFNTTLKVSSYSELNTIVSALLKASVNMLQNETSGKPFSDAMILIEMALQLLPNDEMELLDELYRVGRKV